MIYDLAQAVLGKLDPGRLCFANTTAIFLIYWIFEAHINLVRIGQAWG